MDITDPIDPTDLIYPNLTDSKCHDMQYRLGNFLNSIEKF